MNKTILIIFTYTLLFSCSSSEASEIDTILEKVRQRYLNCISFSCEGSEFQPKKGKPHLNRRTIFNIRYQRPNLFRLNWTDIRNGKETTNSIFTLNGDIYLYRGFLDQYVKQPSLKEALGRSAGSSHGISSFIPDLLVGDRRPLLYPPLTMEEDAVIQDRNCFQIKGKKRIGNSFRTLFVDKETYAILRVEETNNVNMEKLSKTLEKAPAESQAESSAKTAILKMMKTFSSMPKQKWEEVTDYEQPSFDKKTTLDSFEFELPPSAKLANTFQNHFNLFKNTFNK